MLFKKYMPMLAVAGLMFSNANAFGSLFHELIKSQAEDFIDVLQCVENICANNYCSTQCASSGKGEISTCLAELLSSCETSS